MKSIIAAFRDRDAADNAISEVRSGGFDVKSHRVLHEARGNQPVRETLLELQIPEDRSRIYTAVVDDGGALVLIEAEDDNAAQIAAVLDQLGSLELEPGSMRADQNRSAQDLAEGRDLENRDLAEERDIEVIEEEVRVGKREVPMGGVRVRAFVTERPVHETMQLHEERINVKREPVIEPERVKAADAAFTEDEFVVTATGEEAVVEKQARVVERVRVEKEEEVRTETIDETERRRDVTVEPVEERRQGPTTPRR